jgi:nanoRNase/pAp phosphatase (c-di-AMP/oligoRNAs hydrolase)
VGRAENRALVRLLDISALPAKLLDFSGFDRVILVDAVPGGGNVSLPAGTRVDAVFDHHLRTPQGPVPYFWDIRGDVGATSTLVTLYLLAAKVPISAGLATALFYGIKTDTSNMGRDAFPEDRACCKILFDLLDQALLSQIERPERDIDFFQTLHRAAVSMRLCGPFGHVQLGKVAAPDLVGEMADFFHPLESLEWTLCSGVFENSLFFSVRSKKDENAGLVAEQIGAAFSGSGGGHGRMGAGRIPVSAMPGKDLPAALGKVVKKILGVLDLPEKPLLLD